MRRAVRWGLVALAVLAVLYDRAVQIRGVGSADVTVEFVVTDAGSGQPIRGARIVGWAELDGSGCPERQVALETDAEGVARIVAHDITATSTDSGLGVTMRNTIAPVYSIVTVSAPGYSNSGPIELHEPPHRTAVVRVAPRQGTLVVPIRLAKEAPGEPRP